MMRISIPFATGAACAAILLAASTAVLASSAGSVAYLSGTLSVKKADGSVRILSQKSEFENGDTLVTERESYAQLRFADGAQVTMKPNSTVKIDNVNYADDKPQDDSFVFGLLKGGLRSVTGLVGKRSQNKVEVKTGTATIGIRGTTFTIDDCQKAEGIDDCARLAPGVYLNVADGQVIVRNEAGEEVYGAGQFGLIQAGSRPAFLQIDPGLKFVPPSSFRSALLRGGAAVNVGRDLECVVR
jgi:hypothetical protein